MLLMLWLSLDSQWSGMFCKVLHCTLWERIMDKLSLYSRENHGQVVTLQSIRLRTSCHFTVNQVLPVAALNTARGSHRPVFPAMLTNGQDEKGQCQTLGTWCLIAMQQSPLLIWSPTWKRSKVYLVCLNKKKCWFCYWYDAETCRTRVEIVATLYVCLMARVGASLINVHVGTMATHCKSSPQFSAFCPPQQSSQIGSTSWSEDQPEEHNVKNKVSNSHFEENDCHKSPLCWPEHDVVTGQTVNTPNTKVISGGNQISSHHKSHSESQRISVRLTPSQLWRVLHRQNKILIVLLPQIQFWFTVYDNDAEELAYADSLREKCNGRNIKNVVFTWRCTPVLAARTTRR